MRYRRIHVRRQAPAPAEPRQVTALEYYSARLLPDYTGGWVYALGASTDGRVFYVGQSESVLRRLYDHSLANPDLFDWTRVYLIACRDQLQMDARELECIDHYQPERNSAGRTADLRRRVAARVLTRGFNAPPLDDSLDASQVSN